MKALVVDDAPLVRTRVAALLREVSADVEVVEAGDADEAFERIRSGAPDLVVLDIHLPGLNGLQMLPALTRRANPPVVIVLTNDSSEQHRQQCLALGALHFLDKTVEIDRLVDVVTSMVGNARPIGS